MKETLIIIAGFGGGVAAGIGFSLFATTADLAAAIPLSVVGVAGLLVYYRHLWAGRRNAQ